MQTFVSPGIVSNSCGVIGSILFAASSNGDTKFFVTSIRFPFWPPPRASGSECEIEEDPLLIT